MHAAIVCASPLTIRTREAGLESALNLLSLSKQFESPLRVCNLQLELFVSKCVKLLDDEIFGSFGDWRASWLLQHHRNALQISVVI